MTWRFMTVHERLIKVYDGSAGYLVAGGLSNGVMQLHDRQTER